MKFLRVHVLQMCLSCPICQLTQLQYAQTGCFHDRSGAWRLLYFHRGFKRHVQFWQCLRCWFGLGCRCLWFFWRVWGRWFQRFLNDRDLFAGSGRFVLGSRRSTSLLFGLGVFNNRRWWRAFFYNRLNNLYNCLGHFCIIATFSLQSTNNSKTAYYKWKVSRTTFSLRSAS